VNIQSKLEIAFHLIEEFHPITVLHKNLPSFVTFRYRNYTVRPIKMEDIGDFLIEGEIFNKYTSTPFTFKIRVVNTPPMFSS
jgi:hypothetical protein